MELNVRRGVPVAGVSESASSVGVRQSQCKVNTYQYW